MEEAALVKHISEFYLSGFPLQIPHLNEFANEILENRGDKVPVSVNWHLKFFERHGHMKTKFSRPFARAQVIQEKAEIYIEFFERFFMLCRKWGIQEKDTYNMDESGCSIGLHQKSQVIVPADEVEAVALAATDGNREWATLVETVRANRSDIPAFLIYKGLEILQDCIDVVYNTETVLWSSENGWTNNSIEVEWLQHFINHAEPVESNSYRLLILDGHSSHATLVFRNLADDNHIILLYLPPHTTHKLQPLDVGQFGPLAQYYGQFVEDHVRHGFDVSKREYTEWILQARQKANSESNILSAFKKTGLVPFDPDLVLRELKYPGKWPFDQFGNPIEQLSDVQD